MLSVNFRCTMRYTTSGGIIVSRHPACIRVVSREYSSVDTVSHRLCWSCASASVMVGVSLSISEVR